MSAQDAQEIAYGARAERLVSDVVGYVGVHAAGGGEPPDG
jgi:hypothetical protein